MLINRMKLLLDENLSKKLKYHFSAEYSVLTVTEMAWNNMMKFA